VGVHWPLVNPTLDMVSFSAAASTHGTLDMEACLLPSEFSPSAIRIAAAATQSGAES